MTWLLRPTASLSLLFSHGIMSKYLRRQTTGDKKLKLWLLVVKVKTTEEKAKPLSFGSSSVVLSCLNHHSVLEICFSEVFALVQ